MYIFRSCEIEGQLLHHIWGIKTGEHCVKFTLEPFGANLCKHSPVLLRTESNEQVFTVKMNKFIPIFVAVILGLVAVTSGFKCYECDSLTDADCVDNPKQSKFEGECPNVLGSQTTDKNAGHKNVADFVVSILSPRNAKPLTSPKAIYHHCMKFKGSANGNDVVLRSCMPSPQKFENQCEDGSEGGISGEACVCDSELCNGAPSLTAFSILPIIGVVAYSLF